MRIRLVVSLITLLIGTSLSSRGVAAEVLQTTCSVGTINGTYVGRAMFVQSSNGNVRGHCNGSLVSGTDVTEATSLLIFIGTPFGLLACDSVLTPGGQANLSCSN
jgi:hypothetical protein